MADEKKIILNTDPKQGPLDGVQLKTECIRTKFTKMIQKNGCKFIQKQTDASVTASYEAGVFSIRDLKTDMMLSVSVDEAMAVCAAAADASRRLQETKEPASEETDE